MYIFWCIFKDMWNKIELNWIELALKQVHGLLIFLVVATLIEEKIVHAQFNNELNELKTHIWKLSCNDCP